MVKIQCFRRIQLAVYQATLAKSIVIGYHTSIWINGEEILFDKCGIQVYPHCRGRTPLQLIDLGLSIHSMHDAMRVLSPHFKPGTYDLIHKNCNSFSDCMLYFLLGLRLDPLYSTTERQLKEFLGLKFWEVVMDSIYNSNHARFSVDDVVEEIDQLPYEF